MRTKLFVIPVVLIVAALYLNAKTVVAQIIAPCIVGHTSPSTGFWTWPADSLVNIYLRDPDFSQDYVEAVRIAVQNWDAAAAESGSNVHFIFHGLTLETKTGQGDLTITRGETYDKKRHLAFLQAHSLLSNRLIDYALVIVDVRVKNPEVLTNIMAHELGHSLGLMDCYECSRKTTAMSLLKTGTEPNGIEGPTACDKLAVLAAYRELALHITSTAATFHKPSVNEGDLPEAMVTPLVKSPR
jgi:hypothetical protein